MSSTCIVATSYDAGDERNTSLRVHICYMNTKTSITPMEKYDAENAKLVVVEVMPLMRIPLAEV